MSRRAAEARRPRVAWWSPLPPHHSGIADYSAELLPHLASHWEIDLFVDGLAVDPALAERHRVVDVRRTDPAPLHAGYDAVLYHVGNGPAHIYAYQALLRQPGLLVLHDVALTHLVAELTHGRGRTDLLFRELREQHGDEAAEELRRYVYLHEPAPWLVEPLRHPLNRRVLASARAVLVHSRFAAEQVRAARLDVPVEVLEMHAPPPVTGGRRSDGPALVLCTAGYLTPAKRLETVLHALARLRGRVPFAYHVVGELAPGYRIAGLIRDLGLEEQVRLHGRVPGPALDALLAGADVCINLRHPTSGETSAMVLRVLAAGTPVVVSDAGWFSELPDDAVVKVPSGAGEEPALAGALEALARDPDRRRALGEGGRRYAQSHDPASRAAGYAAFVARHAGRAPAATAHAAGALAAAAAELGFDAALAGAEALAGELAGS